MAAQPTWYRESFGDAYFRIHDNSQFEAHKEREALWASELLDLPPGAALLDLCCAWGLHSIALSRLGYSVTGFDLSSTYLQLAQERATRAGARPDWVEGDMRVLPFRCRFDAVVSLGNSFGYFDDESQDLEVLRQVHGTLKPGGRFLLHLPNREAFLRTFQPTRATRLPEDRMLVEEREFDLRLSRLLLRMTMLQADRPPIDLRLEARLYTLREISALLRQASFSVERVTGGLRGADLTLDSPMMCVIARR